MSKIQIEAWKCDLCGHVWPVGKEEPLQCSKCKKRGWNRENVALGFDMSDDRKAARPSAPGKLPAMTSPTADPADYSDPEPTKAAKMPTASEFLKARRGDQFRT